MRWNTRREPMVKHLSRLVRAPGSLVWTNSLSVDAEGYLWIAANRHVNIPKNFLKSKHNNSSLGSTTFTTTGSSIPPTSTLEYFAFPSAVSKQAE